MAVSVFSMIFLHRVLFRIKDREIQFVFMLVAIAIYSACSTEKRWSKEQSRIWQSEIGWRIGANFIPSTASNQLEMWQNATFDIKTIDRELGWAQKYGLNTVRVYLHHLVWYHEGANTFLMKIDKFLRAAEKHEIRTIFVFFDDDWLPDPKIGPQEPPVPGIHNSRWVQDPGLKFLRDSIYQENVLKPYVQDIMDTFGTDERVIFWDLYNEPGSRNHFWRHFQNLEPDPWWKLTKCSILLKRVFKWAREMNPKQPLTSGIWPPSHVNKEEIDKIKYQQQVLSDIITFHHYGPLSEFETLVNDLDYLNERPVLCTEYMARSVGSTFQEIVPYAHENCISIINWGWVSGKIQTIYPWSSWKERHMREPEVWHHDVLRQNGTPFDLREVELMKEYSKKECK